MNARNNATTTRGRPFTRGNPGRPKGARNKVTRAVEALLDGEAEALTRVAIEHAKAGDIAALRLCLERIAPPRKDAPAPFALPAIAGPQDLPAAITGVLQAVADGDLTPAEAKGLAELVETSRRAYETSELAARIDRLEADHGG